MLNPQNPLVSSGNPAESPSVPSPFGLRRQLEIEEKKGPASQLLDLLDSGQGNPCKFGHVGLRWAFADLMALAALRMEGPGGLAGPMPRLDSPLWSAVSYIGELTSRRATDVLEEFVQLSVAAKYPIQPQPSLVDSILRRYSTTVHLDESRGIVTGELVVTAGASAGSYLVLRALVNSGLLGAAKK